MSVSVPVVLCGAMKQVAAIIRANMLPEYDGPSIMKPLPQKQAHYDLTTLRL